SHLRFSASVQQARDPTKCWFRVHLSASAVRFRLEKSRDRRMLKLQEFFEQLQCPIRRFLNLVYNCREVGNFQFFLLASSDAKQVTFQFSMSTPTPQSIASLLTTDEIREQFPSLERRHNGYPVAYF